MSFKIKICGFTGKDELDLLQPFPVNLLGFWFRCGGDRDLTLAELRVLVAHGWSVAERACLVTLDADANRLADVLGECGIQTLQLHSFCLPRQVQAIREAAAGLDRPVEILKVLHFRQGRCAEERLLDAYRNCGADGFILDSYRDAGAIGSTGDRICPETAAHFAARLAPAPTWLAGGLTSETLREVCVSAGFAGFDIDSGVREAGKLSRSRLTALFETVAAMEDGAWGIRREAA